MKSRRRAIETRAMSRRSADVSRRREALPDFRQRRRRSGGIAFAFRIQKE